MKLSWEAFWRWFWWFIVFAYWVAVLVTFEEPFNRCKLGQSVSIRAGLGYVVHTILLRFSLLTLHSVSIKIS